MVGSLLIGLVVGFGMSIPPGPISVAVIKQGVQGNFRTGLRIGIGASLIDCVYALIAAFASSALILEFQDFLAGHAWFELAFQIVCIVILLALGRKYFHATSDDLRHSTEEEELRENKARKFGFSSALMVGLLMGVMNLANPSFLPSLIAVAGFIQAKSWLAPGFWGNALYALGFGAGVFIWFYLLLRLILRMRTRLPVTYFTYIFKFAGGAFYLFALILAVRVFLATDWKALF